MKKSRAEFLEEAGKKKIICFGAGKALVNVISFLESEHLVIDKLLDNSSLKWGTKKEGVLVQSPDTLRDCDEKGYVILISAKYSADDIEEQIKTDYAPKFSIYRWPLMLQTGEFSDEQFWNERIYNPCLRMYKEIAKNKENSENYIEQKKILLRDKDKVILPRTPLVLTARCTLCCKECSNLMPYFSSPKDYLLDDIVQWIDNICDAVDEWICCELIGGEPFLYRDLYKILLYILKKDKIQQVEFTTNASIIPKSDVLELLRNDKVVVKISEYPGLIDYRKLTKVFDEKGIRYSVTENMRWIKMGNPIKRNRSRDNIQSQYLNCNAAKMCRSIMNGKLYVCARAASLMELGYANDLEMIDLLNSDNLRENIKNFLRLTYSKACDYCDIASGDEEFILPAEQMKRNNSLTDWERKRE